MYETLAVGTPFFDRDDKLHNLLESTPSSVSRVIIADNGPEGLDESALDDAYEPPITVLDLEYDCGIGECRYEITRELDSEYLLMLDSDMLVPDGLDVLVDLLDADDDLGGVAGLLYENGRIRAGACDFVEVGDSLLQTGRDLDTEMRDGVPLLHADKVTQNLVLRRAVLETCTWDPDAGSKEHIDFFLRHWKAGEWSWAVCPSVVFRHDTGGSTAYTDHRTSKSEESEAYIKEKYDYEHVSTGVTEPLDTRDKPLPEAVGNAGHRYLPNRYWIPVKERVSDLL